MCAVTIDQAKKLCRQLEIKIISTADRPGPMRTSAVNTIRRMLAEHGQDHVVVVLRAIVEGNVANRAMLREDVVKAISDIVRAHPGWPERGGIWLEAWDAIDLCMIRNTAKQSGAPLRAAITALVCLRLTEILGPSVVPKLKPARVKRERKPPISVTRIPIIEKNIALGRQLLALRSTIRSNAAFGRAVRQQFPDIDSSQACDLAKVARAYGDRPDIYRRLSWNALVQLASPGLPSMVRENLEAAILSGQALTGPDIRRARAKLPPGRPRRASDQTARLAA